MILLFSDGEETMNTQVEELAKMARDKGIKIYTIGVGSEKGSPIPDGYDEWGRLRYKTYHRKIVYSKLNPEVLKEIAQITGGQYFHAENVSDLKNLSDYLEKLPKQLLKEEVLSPQSERY